MESGFREVHDSRSADLVGDQFLDDLGSEARLHVRSGVTASCFDPFELEHELVIRAFDRPMDVDETVLAGKSAVLA